MLWRYNPIIFPRSVFAEVSAIVDLDDFPNSHPKLTLTTSESSLYVFAFLFGDLAQASSRYR